MLQVPPEQAGAPLIVLQAALQAPQFRVSVLLLISQPLAWLPSQLRKPSAQEYWQAPSEQPPETMFGGALAAQSLPQAPQLASSTASSASQPLASEPSQLSKPESHTWPQLPALQDGSALVQSSGQTVVQLPQAVGSLSVLVSQSSRDRFSSLEQSSQPAAQLFMSQLPAVQVGAPLAVLHGRLQPPQWSSSVFRLVSQPSAVPPEQLPQPASQAPMTQLLETQPATALAYASSQSLPQAPQFRSSLVMLTSQPSRSRFSTLQLA